MKKDLIFIAVLFLISISTVASCATKRKCDGQKAINTPMGKM